jgi:hypothetical protein
VGRERELALLAVLGGSAVDLPGLVDEIVANREIKSIGRRLMKRSVRKAIDARKTFTLKGRAI